MSKPFQTNGLYRANDGVVLGVCQGIANWRNIDVFWVRLAAIIVIFLSSIWLGVLAYIVVGLIMPKAPAMEISNDEEEEFYSSVAASRKHALRRLQRTFDELDRRTRRLEDSVTSTEFDWQKRLNSGK